MKHLALIPARMGSSRFPGKPLAPIAGKPMIGHIVERVSACRLLTHTAVATPDEEIAEYVRSIGASAVMTSHSHVRASDRCAEALAILEEEHGIRYDSVVMVQGDEPLVTAGMIEEALVPIEADSSVEVVNLLGTFTTEEEFESPHSIKVVVDSVSDALYFSRRPIPTGAPDAKVPRYKQVCIIPFRRDFLIEYTNLTPTPLEIAESIDMLRVLEHGRKVRMVPTAYESHPVDTEEDLARVEQMMTAARKR